MSASWAQGAIGIARRVSAAAPVSASLINNRVVALGGGTGLSTLLHGLRHLSYPPGEGAPPSGHRERLTAIVSVADDGGSSGILRNAYSMQAPGDIRNCLVALAGCNNSLREIFDFRFNDDIDGHSLGNLILTALTELESGFSCAVARACDILEIHGRVLPATDDNVTLEAVYDDGRRASGESSIATSARRISRISLAPSCPRALPEAVNAILAADLIVIGPGSLYTSLIPVLLIPGIAAAIRDSGAKIILVLNLMTEPGETDGYLPVDFLDAIRRHVPGVRPEALLVNNTRLPEQKIKRYAATGATPIPITDAGLAYFDCKAVFRDLLGESMKLHHDPAKLAGAIQELSI